MNDKAVIEKIEDAYRRVRKIGPDAIYETELREVLRAAADALATRVPVQGEPNDDRELVEKIAGTIAVNDLLREGMTWGDLLEKDRESYRITARNVVSLASRATVPDAATEERIDRWMQLVGKGVEEQMELRAERDAALAAIERVRAIHYNEHGECITCCDEYGPKRWPCPTVKALDGAPEPEWEYGHAHSEHPQNGQAEETREDAERRVNKWNDHDDQNSGLLVRRRPAGPWLPVEGERP